MPAELKHKNGIVRKNFMEDILDYMKISIYSIRAGSLKMTDSVMK